jgi:hypothetical protein
MQDEAAKRKEAVDEDRADPGESGGWMFLKGKDAIRVLRALFRWDVASRSLGLLLLGGCAYYLGAIASRLTEFCELLREAIRHLR